MRVACGFQAVRVSSSESCTTFLLGRTEEAYKIPSVSWRSYLSVCVSMKESASGCWNVHAQGDAQLCRSGRRQADAVREARMYIQLLKRSRDEVHAGFIEVFFNFSFMG